MTRILCRAGAESATMASRRGNNNLGGQLANNNNDDNGHEKVGGMEKNEGIWPLLIYLFYSKI
jgi:hypothetical protein